MRTEIQRQYLTSAPLRMLEAEVKRQAKEASGEYGREGLDSRPCFRGVPGSLNSNVLA